jgi:hypothetical protein
MNDRAMSRQNNIPGQRIFTCGHSFHTWIADMLADLAGGAGIAGHLTVGVSSIGASRAIQHWDVPEQQNEARKALRSGSVDVLTLSCMTQPDEGIRKFAMLAVEHNPDARITLQELWLPEDRFPFDPEHRQRTSVDEFDDPTFADLQKPHEEYFKVMEDYVRALNAEIGKQAVFIVPDAQATLALRAGIIAGTVPGLKKQSALFSDAWGHPTPPLRLLSAYCHFSVIYRRSPVGLPCPAVLADSPLGSAPLNLILQQLAWNAVAHHPLSGAGATGPGQGNRTMPV